MSRSLVRSLAALFRSRADRTGSETPSPRTGDRDGEAPIQPTVLLSEHLKAKPRRSGWRFRRRPRSDDKARDRVPGRPEPGLPPEGSKVPPERRYLDLGEVGHGGMGSVRRVRDRELMRQVVLKRLHPELGGDPDIVQRFVEEAQITGQLDHPNTRASRSSRVLPW